MRGKSVTITLLPGRTFWGVELRTRESRLEVPKIGPLGCFHRAARSCCLSGGEFDLKSRDGQTMDTLEQPLFNDDNASDIELDLKTWT